MKWRVREENRTKQKIRQRTMKKLKGRGVEEIQGVRKGRMEDRKGKMMK
jgi:hypothetical protein